MFWWCKSILQIMRFFGSKGVSSSSGYSSSSTAEQVTEGIDGAGLTAVVTGGSSGIGIETTRVLAFRGVHVVMAVRNVNAGKKVREEIVKEIPTAKIDVMELDLSSMESVRKFALDYNSSGLSLNILINNAGIYETNFMLSQDNIELQFATNYIGHFLLTNLLLESMKKTVCETKREGRIINVSSATHAQLFGVGIHFDKINDKSCYSGIYAYGQSKLANVLHANELARRMKVLSLLGARGHESFTQYIVDEGVEITANSLHPGVIATNILRDRSYIQAIFRLLSKVVLKNIPQGAATTCYVALHPQVKGLAGEYFVNCNIAKASSQATDAELAKKLWEFSLSLTSSK